MRIALSPPAFFLAVALAAGVPLAFYSPPFQVPDEPAHFLRAYAVSEGRLLARNREGRTGDALPVSLAELVARTSAGIPGHPDRRIDRAALAAARELDLRPEERAFLAFPSAALYSPLPYAPQALGIALGRAAGAGPLALLRLARLANLLAAALLVAAALRVLPAYRWLLAAFALVPMALFLRSSVSADALTFAFAAFLGAHVARLAFSPDAPLRRTDVALVAGSAAALCLTKLPYALLALSVLAVRGGPGRRGRVFLVAATLAAALAASGAAAWIALSVEEPVRVGAGVDSGAQIAASLAHPFRFAGLVVRNLADRWPGYAVEVLGRLGWLDALVPLPALALLALGLAALVFLDGSGELRVEPPRRLLLGGLTVAAAVAIVASQYAMWTPYGAAWIEGVQGRYFHPLAPFAVWALHLRRGSGVLSPRGRLAVAGLLAAVAVAATFWTVHARYYSAS